MNEASYTNRLLAIIVVAALLTTSSCVANNIYQERVFKEAALEKKKNMSGNEIACAWQGTGSSMSVCTFLEKK